MSLTEENIIKIAKLARIKLAAEEVPHFHKELTNILGMVEILQEVNTDNVPQMTSVSAMALPWREDAVTDGNCQQAVLQNAPESEYGCFMVPKVIE